MKPSDARLKEDPGVSPRPGRAEILSWVDDSPGPDLIQDSTGTPRQHDGFYQTASWCTDLSFKEPAWLPGFDGHSSDNGIFLKSQMPNKVHWSIPWSDLMMTMFILFVVLFMYHSSKKEFLSAGGLKASVSEKHKTDPPLSDDTMVPFPSSLPMLYDLSKKTVQARDLNSFASVDLIADKAVRIILTGDLLFDLGKAELKEDAKDKLEKLAPLITKTPYKVNVVGHTDNAPIKSSRFPSNWELSLIRASVVARFFIEELNIPGSTFYLSGYSYFQPVRPNSTPENRAANRRVEIIITKERPYGMPLSTEPFSFDPGTNKQITFPETGKPVD